MAVVIDSGDFPLLRNVDHTDQPTCADVYGQWLRIFSDNVPEAMAHLGDVIEDAIRFQLWDKVCRGGPKVMFERMGLFDLDLDAAKRALAKLKDASLSKEVMRAQAREMEAQGKTTNEIAAAFGVTDRTIRNWKAEKNRVMTPKVSAARQRITYQVSNYTKPETAARKLREKFGAEWCQQLRKELSK